jgi:citrate synthase
MKTELKRNASMSEVAKLSVGDQQVDLPVIVGTENEHAVDISKLRGQTGFITLDEGYGNTGSTTSKITYLDGDQGILRYRGYPIEVIAERSNFIETSYLLIYGELPNSEQLDKFCSSLRRHTMLHEDMRAFYNGFPRDAHPMAILSSVVGALSTFYQDSLNPRDPRQVEVSIHRLIAKLPTIAAYAYKKSIGQPLVYPQNDLEYCDNFLRMMFAVPSEITSRTAARRRCGWSVRPTPTCLPRFRPASAPCGDRCTAEPTRLASKCSRPFAPMAATSPSTSTRPRTRTAAFA